MAEQRSEFRNLLIFAGALVVLVAVGVGLGAMLLGPAKKRMYDRSSPDAIIDAARQMVENREAERLGELFYADSDGMRELYARLGAVLGHLQDLALAINERFPEDVAQIKAEAEAAAKSGRGMSLLQQLNPGARRQRSRIGAAENEQHFNLLFQTIAADPYAWLTDARGRLTYTAIDDERMAVLLDGKPVLPPLGLVLREDQGQWSVVLPLNAIPGISRFMPQTPEEFSIWASLIQMVDNVVIDLEIDVREGKMQSLDALARRAGEKAVIPMGMGMIAYERATQERRRRERAERESREQPAEAGGG
jgi:hypothetical protein